MSTSTTVSATARPSSLARRTGLAYLGIIATGIFAEFAVRGTLVVDDDPIATAENIAESPGLFGIGIGADVVMIALDVIVAFGLLGLLRHVNRRMAITATVLRLIQGIVIAVNLINLTERSGSPATPSTPAATRSPDLRSMHSMPSNATPSATTPA